MSEPKVERSNERMMSSVAFVKRRWFWTGVVALYGWLSAVPVLRRTDFPYFDGALYFDQALTLARELSFARVDYETFFNPLFTVFGAGLIALLPFDALHVYYSQILILYTLFAALLHLVLSEAARPWVAAFVAIAMLASGVVLRESVHGIHLFSACWLAATTLLVLRGGARSLPAAVVLAAVGTFVRPEFLVIALGLGILQGGLALRQRIARPAVIASSIGLVMLLGLFVAWKPASERSLIVLCQSYEWNVYRAEGGDFDPSRCAHAFPRDFGAVESVVAAAAANPSAFATHVVRNAGNFVRTLHELAPTGPSSSAIGALLLAAGALLCLVQLARDAAEGRAPMRVRGDVDRWVIRCHLGLVLVSVVGPLLIAQSHPKYLIGLLPIVGYGVLVLLDAAALRLRERVSDEPVPATAGSSWMLQASLGMLIVSFLVALPIEARRGAIRGISSEQPHFAPISARLAELSLSVSDVTIAGHSARSYATILNHDRPGIAWRASSSLSAQAVGQADILVLHPRFVRNVVDQHSEAWLRETLARGDYIRASHAGWPEVTVYVRRTILAQM